MDFKERQNKIKLNEMIANLSQFQAIAIINKKHIDEFEINDELRIKVDSSVTLFGNQIDENLKFDSHIEEICKKAAK